MVYGDRNLKFTGKKRFFKKNFLILSNDQGISLNLLGVKNKNVETYGTF